MTTIERRTLKELLVRYELEPTISDIFVEGKFDKEIYTHCLRKNHEHERMVYEIDTVDIPFELLSRHELTDGNKQRVIALARELSTQGSNNNYRCLVDRDLDPWFGPLEATRGLVWINFTSIELHFYSEDVLRDILLITAKATISDLQIYLNSLTTILQLLFELRLADRELTWCMEWIPTEKFLSTDGDSVKFDLNLYIERLLIKNHKSKFKPEFTMCISKWHSCLSGDPRNFIRGHDLTELMSWSIKAFHGLKDFNSQLTIERLFILIAPSVSSLLQDLK